MTSKKVIARKLIPTFLPFRDTVIAYLLLDHFNPPGWVWGMVIAFFIFAWIGSLYNLFSAEEEIDIFKL